MSVGLGIGSRCCRGEKQESERYLKNRNKYNVSLSCTAEVIAKYEGD